MIVKGNQYKKTVDPKSRVQLIRKGNEFFTDGNIVSAEKIFLTVDYKDGILRLADYYLKSGNIKKAITMYFISENSSKIKAICETSAKVIQKWLKEDQLTDKLIIKK